MMYCLSDDDFEISRDCLSGFIQILNCKDVAILLPIFSKVFEKVVYKRLFNYFNKFDILFQNQYGFRKGHSTSLALHHLYDKISAGIDHKKFTAGIFLDLSKS